MTIEECQALSKGELIEVVQEAYAEIDRLHEELVMREEATTELFTAQLYERESLVNLSQRHAERASTAWAEALQAAVRTLQRMTVPGEPYSQNVERAILALPRAVP